MKVWNICTNEISIAKFLYRKDAEKALKYLEEKYDEKFEIVKENVFEKFEELLVD